MRRRSFLKLVGSLPFMGFLGKNIKSRMEDNLYKCQNPDCKLGVKFRNQCDNGHFHIRICNIKT